MQVTVEVSEGLERRIKVAIPQQQVEEKVKARIKEIQPRVTVSGFRPGKVPEKVVKRTHGEAIQHEIAGQLTQETVFDAIKQVDLKPLTRPRIELVQLGNEGPLEYTASFEVAPEFEIVAMDNKSFETVSSAVSEQKIDDTLDKLRAQHGDWRDIERPAANGDRVTIDFEGSIGGELFEGGAAEGFELELGAGNMIPGFEDGVLNAKTGDELTIDVTFPDNYHASDLVGKVAQFKIKVHKVCEKALAELDEAFVKRLGVESGDINEFRTQISERLQHELDDHLEQLRKNMVFGKLAELNDIEVPKGLVREEAAHIAKQRQDFAKMAGIPDLPVEASKFTEQAQLRVKLGLLVNQYAQEHNITVDDDVIRDLVEKAATAYDQPSELVRWYYEKPERLEEFNSRALENLVVNHILEHAKNEVKTVDYDEAMNMKATLLS